MNLYHNERPLFFRYQQSFTYQESKLELYLELDKKDIITGLYYQWSGASYFEKDFSDYAKKVEGRHLSDIPIANGQGWSYPFFFYRQFILQITGAQLPISFQKGKDPYGLICRCCAVYEDDIRSLIQTQLDSENYDFLNVYNVIGTELMATIGCGSCKQDVESILSEYIQGERELWQDASSADEASPIARWQSLDSQALASESYTLLKSISSQIKTELRLLGTRPGSILIKSERALDALEMSAIEDTFIDALGHGLDLQIK